jgi:hypothetical protein
MMRIPRGIAAATSRRFPRQVHTRTDPAELLAMSHVARLHSLASWSGRRRRSLGCESAWGVFPLDEASTADPPGPPRHDESPHPAAVVSRWRWPLSRAGAEWTARERRPGSCAQ